MPEFFPDIDEYLENTSDSKSVTSDGLEELINKIVVHTGLPYKNCQILVEIYFNLIRTELLKGNEVILFNIGKMVIKCPKNGLNKTKVSLIIKPFRKLLNKIKYD